MLRRCLVLSSRAALRRCVGGGSSSFAFTIPAVAVTPTIPAAAAAAATTTPVALLGVCRAASTGTGNSHHHTANHRDNTNFSEGGDDDGAKQNNTTENTNSDNTNNSNNNNNNNNNTNGNQYNDAREEAWRRHAESQEHQRARMRTFGDFLEALPPGARRLYVWSPFIALTIFIYSQRHFYFYNGIGSVGGTVTTGSKIAAASRSGRDGVSNNVSHNDITAKGNTSDKRNKDAEGDAESALVTEKDRDNSSSSSQFLFYSGNSNHDDITGRCLHAASEIFPPLRPMFRRRRDRRFAQQRAAVLAPAGNVWGKELHPVTDDQGRVRGFAV